MSFVIGIDIGTSGTKIVLVDETGEVKASSYREYPLSQPKANWAEQNPEDWWEAVVKGLQDIWEKSHLTGKDIAGIGLSGQMHGAVLLDSNNQVLRPAILWCDQRTGAECDFITKEVGEKQLYHWTGNPALTGFTAPKILWLERHEFDTYQKIKQILLPKDYIRFRLTGKFASDVSDASGTLLMDVANRSWSQNMLKALNISEDWLPQIYESPEITGGINMEAAQATGLLAGTPVVGGGGDQAAGAVGNGIVEEGILSAALGTSGVVFAMTNEPVIQPGSSLHAFCHAVPGKWHLMGVMLSAGASLQWFRNQLATNASYDELAAEAMKVGLGAEGLLFLPYLLGERTPYPDPLLRGSFIGLTMRHQKGHLTRAIMEGVSFGLMDSMELLSSAGVALGEVRASGGGAKSQLWRSILADIFQQRITTINTTDGPAFGAALLAAVGAGIFTNVEEACRKTIKLTSAVEPEQQNMAAYQKLYNKYKEMYPLLKSTMHYLSNQYGN
ncbi:MAG: xylulokinase [Bacillota bacterium]|nr:xylulokinase [Bacillota bacterium]